MDRIEQIPGTNDQARNKNFSEHAECIEYASHVIFPGNSKQGNEYLGSHLFRFCAGPGWWWLFAIGRPFILFDAEVYQLVCPSRLPAH